jgi:hypothetical protein
MRYFFYGTLLDAALRRLVLGRLSGRRGGEAAVLDGYQARIAAGKRYPVAVRTPGAAMPGLLMTLPHRRAAARINAYEGHEYRRARRTVRIAGRRGVSAVVFLPTPRARATRTDWDLDLWRQGAARRRRDFRRVLSG